MSGELSCQSHCHLGLSSVLDLAAKGMCSEATNPPSLVPDTPFLIGYIILKGVSRCGKNQADSVMSSLVGRGDAWHTDGSGQIV